MCVRACAHACMWILTQLIDFNNILIHIWIHEMLTFHVNYKLIICGINDFSQKFSHNT